MPRRNSQNADANIENESTDDFYNGDSKQQEQDKSSAKPEQPARSSSCWTCGEIILYLILVMELGADLWVILRGLGSKDDAWCCAAPMAWMEQQSHRMTVGYLVLVCVEAVLLIACLVRDVVHKQQGIRDYNYDNEDYYDDSMSCCVDPGDCCSPWNAVFCTMCLNPFIGAAVLWTQLFLLESSKQAWMWLSIEIVAVLFWYWAVYLAQGKLALCTLMLQCVHWAPLAVVACMIWYMHDTGGICYVANDEAFWFDGCDLCSDGFPPSGQGKCPDGGIPAPHTFCGAETQDKFCFFSID